MMRYSYLGMFLLALLVTLSSCEVIGDIFRVGFTAGIIVVVVVVILIIWLISRFRR